MKKNKKFIINFILFILLIFLTFYILLKDQDFFEIYNLVIASDKKFILIAIICMFIYLLFEAINLRRTLKAAGDKIKIISALKYAYIGFFYSAITPAATGGQPMQIYYMHKDKISVANATLSLLMNLFSFQIITISMAIVSLVFLGGYLQGGMIALFIVGISLNSSALALLMIGIFWPKVSKALINFVVKIMRKLKLKNIEQKEEKLNRELDKYQGSAAYIRDNKKIIVKILLTTFAQVLFYYSIPYWIYRSLGFSEASIIKAIGLQALLYATVSGIPLPGAVGVSESGFINIFKNIFTEGTISGAMLLNRGVSFYLFVFISAIVSMIGLFKRRKDNENIEEEQYDKYSF